jgi:NAD(P)H dehydrogenase (quinone)
MLKVQPLQFNHSPPRGVLAVICIKAMAAPCFRISASRSPAMKHAVIVAHPNPGSFTCAVAKAYADAVRGFGDEAVLRDLYRMGFDPCLRASELPWAKDYAPGADVAAEREALSDAKVFVLVYPLWFNAPPAMLKGYIDRVFGTGFGFRSAHAGAEPMLAGRVLVSFTSSGAPATWVEQTGAVRMLQSAFDDHLAQMCGLSVLLHHHFGGVTPGLATEAVDDLLGQVRAAAQARFAPVTEP